MAQTEGLLDPRGNPVPDLAVPQPKLFHFLSAIDDDLATRARREGCGLCGSALHSAHYPRKPRNGPMGLAEASHTMRHSFCCERCRKRMTPPSVRFLGRMVYPAFVVVLLSAMHSGITDHRVDELRAILGVARRTLQRWRRWWQESFVQTELWQIEQGRLMPPIEPTALPAGLLERFLGGDARTRLIQCLRFVAPVSVPGAIKQRDAR
jgi:hypothetical protein